MTSTLNDGSGFLLSWEDYSDADIFVNLRNIKRFAVIVQYPSFMGDTKRLRESIADRLYEEFYAILTTTKLHKFDTLTRVVEGNQLGVRYRDDDNAFEVTIDDRMSLQLSRSGSSMERFYKWYVIVMPFLNQIVGSATSEYESAINARQGSELSLVPTQAMYQFNFLLHTFTKSNSRKKQRNSRLISALLSKVPGAEGELVDFKEDLFPELGRVDISMNRWNKSPAGTVREVFELEAPSNRDYGALWVNFSFIGETGRDEAPPREMVNFLVSRSQSATP